MSSKQSFTQQKRSKPRKKTKIVDVRPNNEIEQHNHDERQILEHGRKSLQKPIEGNDRNEIDETHAVDVPIMDNDQNGSQLRKRKRDEYHLGATENIEGKEEEDDDDQFDTSTMLLKDLIHLRLPKQSKRMENIKLSMEEISDQQNANELHQDIEISPNSQPTQNRKSLKPQVKALGGKIVLDPNSVSLILSDEEQDNVEVQKKNTKEKIVRKKWLIEDTNDFYKALQQYGTDFSMIQSLFPDRTREQIKSKFKKEENENATKVYEALKSRIAVDLEWSKNQSQMRKDKETRKNKSDIEKRKETKRKSNDNSIKQLQKLQYQKSSTNRSESIKTSQEIKSLERKETPPTTPQATPTATPPASPLPHNHPSIVENEKRTTDEHEQQQSAPDEILRSVVSYERLNIEDVHNETSNYDNNDL